MCLKGQAKGDRMVAQLFAGMFIGSIIASVVWFFVLRAIKTKTEHERKTREELMHSLGELWVEIDTLISSVRSGMMDEQVFKKTFSTKIESANHILKPNLHLFDVYYVKYIENLIKDYKRRALHHADDALSNAFNSEMETNYAVVPQPEQTDLFASQIEEIPTVATTEAPADAVPAAEEESFTVAEVAKEEQFEQPPETADLEIVSEQPDTPVAEEKAKTPVSDEVDAMFEEAFSAFDEDAKESVAAEVAPVTNKESAPVAEEKAPAETDEEFSFELAAAPAKETTAAPETEKVSVPASEKAKVSPLTANLGEEDFTMETLMDVDLGTLQAHMKNAGKQNLAEDLEKTRHFDLIPDEKPVTIDGKTELEVVIASDVAHTESSVRTSATDKTEIVDAIPEETTFTKSDTAPKGSEPKEMAIDLSDDFEVIISDEVKSPAVKTADAPVMAAEAESDMVTGDDIADKIASFESFSPKTTEKKQSEPEKTQKAEEKSSVEPQPKAIVQPSQEKKKAQSSKDGDDSITGDDVADKMDSFFGLFK